MASVFLYHVVGDLTVGKPELSEFSETETLAAAIRTIGDTSEGGIPVWRKRSQMCAVESAESRQQRFVGILNALDIVAFLAREDCLADQDKAINTPVSEVVVPDSSALKVVDPGTSGLHNGVEFDCVFRVDFWQRLIDALEMMKHGVKRFLVPKSSIWRGMSKRFSILYNGRWLKNADPPSGGSSTNTLVNTNRPPSSSTSSIQDKFCCLSREDVLRFLIGCLGALAPLPLSSIASSELSIQTTVALKHPFVMGVEDNMNSRSLPNDINSLDEILANGEGPNNRLRKFSSRSIGFFGNWSNPNFGIGRSMYRGRSAPLTCKVTSSLAAVMAQMLSHRASHVWVTEAENDDNLVGVVGYADILSAVTRQPPAAAVSENS
ncbi:hypothetical protein DH2020_021804 [Rehmannia glutinosa]|uniref:CBS domain-containing protein n=1 Tax=Rehmannia glutinosa TaxID=99300 RepID=A0ABR0WD41_REHGL